MTHINSVRAGWTDERTEKLKVLHGQGLSASQIAKILGGVTRNAVIGRAHRIGLGPIGGGRASAPPRHKTYAPAQPRSFGGAVQANPFELARATLAANRIARAEAAKEPPVTSGLRTLLTLQAV